MTRECKKRSVRSSYKGGFSVPNVYLEKRSLKNNPGPAAPVLHQNLKNVI